MVRAEGPERLIGEWWGDDAPRKDAPPVPGTLPEAEVRDYFRVEDTDGRRYWLFRRVGDGAGEWFLHGLFA